MSNMVCESVIPKEICESFINDLFNKNIATESVYLNPNSKTPTYTVGEQRITKVCWADSNSPIGLLLFNQILIANQKSNWLFDIDFIENVQIGEYSIGGHYDWHQDQTLCARDGSGTQRKLSLTLLLSDQDTYEGGDLLFDGSDEPLTRKQGSVIVFPSCLKHTVTPVTSGVRYSAVAWARGPHFR